MKFLAYCISLLLLLGCQLNQTKRDDNPIRWSVKFADASIMRFDSLIHYNNAPKPRWEYDFAFLGLAIDKLGNIDKKYSDYMQSYIDYFVDSTGHINEYKIEDYNIDRVNPGKNLIVLYKRTGEEKYKTAIETLVEQMKSHPKTESGGYWHKKIYPWQMWLDGIYMASPFLAQYAKEFNQPEWFDVVTHQIKLIYSKTYDPSTGLLYHAWDESRQQRWCNPETGQSKHFWSRATGWYMMALVDVLDFLPDKHPDRDSIISILKATSEALLKVRDSQTGLWFQVLDMAGEEGNYPEASGSAMFIYAFAKGARKGYLDQKYLETARQAFNSLISNLVKTDEKGLPVLTNVCGGCGLGGNPYREGDYNYYIHEKKVDNDLKGVAPLILAAIEINK
jgi:unsaturated rhamnogalacturonyl hydrolase